MKNTKMNISINREYTTLAQADKVKADVKEFKGMYTAGDVVRAFTAALEAEREVSAAVLVALEIGEVVSFTADAFPGGYVYNDETHFSVEVIVENYSNSFIKAHFYTDMNLTVNLYSATRIDPHLRMFSLESFTKAEQWK